MLQVLQRKLTIGIMKMFTKKFLVSAGERAIKTFAQTGLAFLGTGHVGIISIEWGSFLSIAAGAAVLSVLTSVATKK